MGIFNNPKNDLEIFIFQGARGYWTYTARHIDTGKFLAQGPFGEWNTSSECEDFVRILFKDVKQVVVEARSQPDPPKDEVHS